MLRLGGRRIETLDELMTYYESRIADFGFTAEAMFYQSAEQHQLKLSAYGALLAEFAPSTQVADLGCGYGAALDYWPAALEYAGFDLQSSFVSEARRRYPGYNFQVAAVGDIRQNFDHAILVGVLSSVPSPIDLLADALTVAKVSVLFDVTMKDRLPTGFNDLNQWSAEHFAKLRAAGVRVEPMVDLSASWAIFRASRSS